MTIGFREGSAADRDAVLALRALVFPHDDPEKQHADFWNWEFREGYAGQGRFFIAEEGDGVVGHFAFVPQQYTIGTRAVRGALAVDVMTHPGFRRQHVFSRLSAFAASQLKREFQAVTALQIREEVRGGMEAGGWHAVADVPVLLKPISLLRIARDLIFGASVGQTTEDRSDGDSIRSLNDGDFHQIDTLLASPAAHQPRSADFLRWRYVQNPHWRYEMNGFFEGGQLRAFVVHRDSTLRGVRSLAFVDAGVAAGAGDALGLLMKDACARSRRRGCAVAATLMSRDHPSFQAMSGNGFVPGPHRFRLLLQTFDRSLSSLADGPWSLSWGDTDHL